MNYDLVKTVEGRRKWTDDALPYGELPPSMLITKFEETDMGSEEDVYDDYARQTLTNWGPDTNKFEYEEARGGVTRRSGRLQAQYYGHRGNVDIDPYRPEYFDGFAGDEDRDPRGINTDPDFKEMTRQEQARMRFVRWDPDACENITGLGRSESKVVADHQTLFKMTKDRLKVFSRQIDGKRNEVRREFPHKSNISKQVLVQSYGDYIKDYALNPQRRANIICSQILRDTRAWHDETADADFAIAKYNQICRRKKSSSAHNPVKDADTDGKFSDGDLTSHYKALGILMSNVVRGKKQSEQNMANSDMEFSEGSGQITQKSASLKDMSLILRAMTQDSNFSTSDKSMIFKTPNVPILEHLMRQVCYNHLTPAHHLLNAEIIYKNKSPTDMQKIKSQVITDANAPEIRDTKTVTGKMAKMKIETGAKLNTTDDSARAESAKTYNYRFHLCNKDRRARITDGDYTYTEGDYTQVRRPNHVNYRSMNPEDTVLMNTFGDNSKMERHARPMGSKYMVSHIDQDNRQAEISANA